MYGKGTTLSVILEKVVCMGSVQSHFLHCNKRTGWSSKGCKLKNANAVQAGYVNELKQGLWEPGVAPLRAVGKCWPLRVARSSNFSREIKYLNLKKNRTLHILNVDNSFKIVNQTKHILFMS